MSLFAESSWEADAVGDKLSKQLFHKKKKGKKNGRKSKPGSTVSLPKNDKGFKNIKLDNNVKTGHAKPKSKKKRSQPSSVGNEESVSSDVPKEKSCRNVQLAENGKTADKHRKINDKKRKRSRSQSAAPEESPPKKSRPIQSANPKTSESQKLNKNNKNLVDRSRKGSNVPNKKLLLSKKDKAVINKKANRNAEGAKGKSLVLVSKTEQQSGDQETKSQKKRKKRKLKKIAEALKASGSQIQSSEEKSRAKSIDVQRLEKLLALKERKESGKSKVYKEPKSLRDRMMSQLRASRFRFLNETLYNNESSESKKYFKEDPEAFAAYHSGYRQQVEQWPLNPLDVIISSIKKMSKEHVIADFGCGEARLAESVEQKVHSFDLVAVNDNVKACDMAHTPLLTNGVNVVVFCLSLMGTNLADYLLEANRVLKTDGILKIADVESRFENVDEFVSLLGSYGFVNTWKDLSHNLFYFMDFKKVAEVSRKTKNLPEIALKPCLYKRR